VGRGKTPASSLSTALYPLNFNRYIEPFFSSGAVFFDLHGSGRLRNHDAV
jgi:site-specific DNA-adenine methylase